MAFSGTMHLFLFKVICVAIAAFTQELALSLPQNTALYKYLSHRYQQLYIAQTLYHKAVGLTMI